MKWWPFSPSKFMRDDLSALKSAERLLHIFYWFSFPLTMLLHPRFGFNIQVWLCLKHLCMDIHVMTFLHIMADANFPLVQFSLLLHPRFSFNI